MTKDSLLKASIDKRLQEERYVQSREKKKRKKFNIQFIIILSILIGLFFSVLRLIPYFVK